MTLRKHFDPHAPCVVYMRRDSTDRATRDAWDIFGPQLGRQILDKIHRHAMARVPRCEQRLLIAGSFGTLFRLAHGFDARNV